jgi:RNA polymerase primary sigma factor
MSSALTSKRRPSGKSTAVPGEDALRLRLESAEDAQYSRRSVDEQNAEIFDRFRRGATVGQLAEEYGRSPKAVARLIHSLRVKRLSAEPIEFVYSHEFEQPDAETVILGPAPESKARKTSAVKVPAGLPPYLANLYQIPLLGREEEVHHFRKMNYLKFRASELWKNIGDRRPTVAELDRVEGPLKQAEGVKQLLIRSNLRLVVSIAKRFYHRDGELFDLVSDGNMALIRAVEKFDYSKGFKLSTYATWAVQNRLAQPIPGRKRERERFRTGQNYWLQHSAVDDRPNSIERERANQVQRQTLDRLLGRLDPRDRDIISSRFGLEDRTEPQTLSHVGRRHGVSKERIRQLEVHALAKLRQFAVEERLDIPGV